MKWHVKEISRLTGVTAQTLYHYDRIGLLKPSLRESNGYRLYTESDLMQLQRIIALKSFGFTLAQTREVLEDAENPLLCLKSQMSVLDEKITELKKSREILRTIYKEHAHETIIPWEKTLELIQAYQPSKNGASK